MGVYRLRPKLYRIKSEKGPDTKCKGVKKIVKKKEITRKDFIECLYSETEKSVYQNIIWSHDHNLFSETIHKKALSAKDDKRNILEDGISTLAIGHWRVVDGQSLCQRNVYLPTTIQFPKQGTLASLALRAMSEAAKAR